jgi:hypothetical protein
LLSFAKGIFDLLAVGNIAIDFEHGVVEQLHPAVDDDFPPVFADMIHLTTGWYREAGRTAATVKEET